MQASKLASDLTTTQELVHPRQMLTLSVLILIWRMRSLAQKPETGSVFQVRLRNEDGREEERRFKEVASS